MAVTVYTLPDCIQCEMTKKLLDRHNITYSTVDISQDDTAKQTVEALGYKAAPVVVYDKFNWSGFKPDKINALHLLLLEKGIKKGGTMTTVAKKATPAAIAVLRQATALRPKRKKASDGLLPSAAHLKQSPNSDHNTGYAADLTHDPKNGIDCFEIYEKLQSDKRVKYLIFQGKIWSAKNGEARYTGINQHNKHLHISIKDNCGNDTSPWFPWMGKAPTLNKVKASVKRLPKKENK